MYHINITIDVPAHKRSVEVPGVYLPITRGDYARLQHLFGELVFEDYKVKAYNSCDADDIYDAPDGAAAKDPSDFVAYFQRFLSDNSPGDEFWSRDLSY